MPAGNAGSVSIGMPPPYSYYPPNQTVPAFAPQGTTNVLATAPQGTPNAKNATEHVLRGNPSRGDRLKQNIYRHCWSTPKQRILSFIFFLMIAVIIVVLLSWVLVFLQKAAEDNNTIGRNDHHDPYDHGDDYDFDGNFDGDDWPDIPEAMLLSTNNEKGGPRRSR